MGEKGGAQQPLHQRRSGSRAAAAITVVLAAAFFMTYGNATTLAPNWVNTTGGDLSEVGSLDGGGNAISVSDDVDLQENKLTMNSSSGGLSFQNSKGQSGKMYMNFTTNDLVITGRDLDQKLTLNDSGELQYYDWNGDMIFSAKPTNEFKVPHNVNADEVNDVKYVATGDASDIQPTIDECGTDCTVYIPPGNYQVSNTIDVPSDITIQGGGRSVTGVKTSSDIAIFNISGQSNVNIQDISFSNSPISSGSICINATDPGRVRLIDVQTFGCDTGLRIRGDDRTAFIQVIDSEFTDANTGVHISGQLDAVKFTQTDIHTNNNQGLFIEDTSKGTILFSNLNMQQVDAYGINITNSSANTIGFDQGLIAGEEFVGASLKNVDAHSTKFTGFTARNTDRECLEAINSSSIQLVGSDFSKCSLESSDTYDAVYLENTEHVTITGTDFIGTTHRSAVNGTEGTNHVTVMGGRHDEGIAIDGESTIVTEERTNLVDASALQQNLVGYWGFEQNGAASSPDTAFDSTQYENNGTLGADTDGDSAEPSWIAGKDGTSLDFDGTDDEVNISFSSSLNFTDTDPITITGWVKPRSVETTGIISQSTEIIMRTRTNGDLEFILNSFSSNDRVTSSDFETGKWQYFAGTYNTTHLCVQLDYEQKNCKKPSGTYGGNTANWIIGDTGDLDQNLDGMLDNIRVYNRSLSDTEIQSVRLGLGDQADGHLALK